MATLSGLFRQLVARREPEPDFPAIGQLIQSGRLDEAEARLATLGSAAALPYARLLRARIHRERGQLAEALALLEGVLEEGESEAARLELAAVARASGDRAAERAHYEALLRLNPDAPHVLSNLGLCLVELGEPDEAVTTLERALEIAPDFAPARVNLARALLECGRYAESLAQEERVLAVDPDSWATRFRLAHLQILTGKLEEGWRGYEARRQHPSFPRVALPAWEGGDVRGTRLLVYGEQGLGDAILFARFLPMLAARGARLVFKTRPALERLMRSSLAGQPIDVRAELPHPEAVAAAHAPLLSLPYLLGLGGEAARPVPPYIHPPQALVAQWRDRLAASSAPRIGLVWAGNPARRWDETRSVPLDALAPLAAARPDATWVSLQLPRGPLPFAMQDFMADVTDFADTAAIIASLDLVIAVDTSIAHCAAAMGKPVWLLAPRAPCWRWIVGDRESPWYDGVRLFRTARSRDWPSVVAAVARALPEFAAH